MTVLAFTNPAHVFMRRLNNNTIWRQPSFPTWPATTNRLRNSRYIPSSGWSTRGWMPLPLKQLEGNSLRNSGKAFAPVDRHAHQLRSVNQRGCQREIYPLVLSKSLGPVATQCRVSPFFLPMFLVTDPHQSPQTVHRRHETNRS